MSGFRKGHECQGVLVRFSESVKRSLDQDEVAAALLPDLSKAFDCLPHGLLVSKMYAYGLSRTSCRLIATCYLKDRCNRVKMAVVRSDWQILRKGTPQGSVMGPFAYNAHTNDLILGLADMCDTFNYADDNTACFMTEYSGGSEEAKQCCV